MRILVVRIGRSGDIVMTTPALSALLECYPDAEFTLLTSPDGNRLLKNYSPLIANIWVWDRSLITAGLEKRRIKKKINNVKFDKVFCFETRKSIVHLCKVNNAQLYTPKETETDIHTTHQQLTAVRESYNHDTSSYYANLPVSLKEKNNISTELSNIGIDENDIVIALHPTFSSFSRLPIINRNARKNKLWPAKNYASLGEKLAKHTLENNKRLFIIIDLLESECALGKAIVNMSSGHIKLLSQPANMERYKALLDRVDVLVSPDTGPMHIAAAVNTRVVALFSGNSPKKCGPYIPPNMFTVLRAEDTSNSSHGISSISVELVYQACLQQLDRINTKVEINA